MPKYEKSREWLEDRFSFIGDKHLRSFVIEVEFLRCQRLEKRKRSNRVTDARDKKYTQTDLDEKAWYSYLDVLKRPSKRGRTSRVKYVPTRDVVTRIINYLDCTEDEAAKLLLVAGYTGGGTPGISADRLPALKQLAEEILTYLRLPGYLISRDWNVLYWNRAVEILLGISEEEVSQLEKEEWPPNILKLLVDQRHSPWKTIHAAGFDNWCHVIEANIYRFKSINKHFRSEDWYAEVVQRVITADTTGVFANRWNLIDIERPLEDDPPLYTMKVFIAGHTITIRPLLISASNSGTPDIVAYMPVDDHGRRVFHDLGLH